MVVEQAASSTPIETRLAADGVAYSWAEFESYYFDADMAAEIWEAAEVVAAHLSSFRTELYRSGPC